MAVIGILLVLLTPFGLCPDESPSPASTQDVIVSLIQSLDNANLDDGRCTEEICRLPRPAPASTEAQQATIRYLERIAAASGSRGVPVFWARSLSLYDTSFAAKLMTLLSESQNDSVNPLCLTTLALMREKSSGQVQMLKAYVQRLPHSVSQVRAQIVLAIVGGALDRTTVHEIDKSIHDRDRVGNEAIFMATLVGFRGWATDDTISEVKHCLHTNTLDDYSCGAAMSLAIFGYCDKRDEAVIRTLLTTATRDSHAATARVCCAYALAHTSRDDAESFWRIIATTVGRKSDHTLSYVIDGMLLTVLPEHAEIVRRLCKEPDPDLAAGAARLWRAMTLVLGLDNEGKPES